MQIQKSKNSLVIKDKSSTITFGGTTSINDVELEGAGEYEIGGTIVTGFQENSYLFDIEEISMGSVDFRKSPNEKTIERVSNVEVFVALLNGELNKANDVVSQSEPKVAIFAGSSQAAELLSKTSIKFEKIDSLKISKADLGGEEPKNYFFTLDE